MALVDRKVTLNVCPGSIKQIVNVSQYDNDGGALVVTMMEDTQAFNIPAGANCVLIGTKPDGYGFSYGYAGPSSGFTGDTNVVRFNITQQMTAVDGPVDCEVRVSLNSRVIGTGNFILMVEKGALNESTVISDSDIPYIVNAQRYAQEAEGSAAEAAESAVQAASVLETSVKYTDLVNNATYTGTAGQKALDAKMGKTLSDAIDDKLNVTMGVADNPSLRFGVGSNADPSVNPHIELRRAGGSGSYGLSLMYYNSEGSTQGNSVQLVSPQGDVLPTLAPKNHAGSSAATYGAGTASNFGHVKLNDSYTSSGGAAANSVGASSKALVDAYAALNSSKIGYTSGIASIADWVAAANSHGVGMPFIAIFTGAGMNTIFGTGTYDGVALCCKLTSNRVDFIVTSRGNACYGYLNTSNNNITVKTITGT